MRYEYCPKCNRHLADGYGGIKLDCRTCGFRQTA